MDLEFIHSVIPIDITHPENGECVTACPKNCVLLEISGNTIARCAFLTPGKAEQLIEDHIRNEDLDRLRLPDALPCPLYIDEFGIDFE